MLKTKIRKISKTYIQEVFWLIFVLVVSWAIIVSRPDNTEIPITYKTGPGGNISSVQQSAVKP